MTQSSILETFRLRLRPLTLDDAPTMAKLAGRREIADTTISVPHPYSEQQAREWISERSQPDTEKSKEIVFAIVSKETDQLIGAVGLRSIDREHSHAEMGLWLGVEFWGQGYATEATKAALRFAFEQLRLNRVHAHHMARNPKSGRVLEKAGFKREGLLRQCVRKWGVFEDVVLLAILRKEWKDE